MYSTISGNYKDNSSIYSGSSANTSGSAAFGRNRRVVPRSNSTSDLYEIPSVGNGLGKRKKQLQTLPHGQSSTGVAQSRVVPRANSWAGNQCIPTGTQSPHHHVPQYKQQQQTLRQGLYRAQSKSNSLYTLEPKSSLNSIPERRQPNYVLTPYQLQRKQMKGSFQFPNGENFTPRSRLGNSLPRSNSSIALPSTGGASLRPLTRSQSMNSLPLNPIKNQKHLMTVPASATSPVESGSSNSSYNSMRDHSSGSTNLSSGPSAHSSNVALPLGANEKLQSSSLVVKPGLASERKRLTLPSTVGSGQPSTFSSTSDKKAPIAQVLSTDKDSDAKKNQGSLVKSQSGSKTKLGSFFKKIFSLSSSPSPNTSASSSSSSLVSLGHLSPLSLTGRKKRKRTDADISSSSMNSPRPIERPASSKQRVELHDTAQSGNRPQAVDEATADVEINLPVEDDENEEDSDDILMDTDLVFDSLLLKADLSRPSCQQKQIELRQKLKDLPHFETVSSASEADVKSGQISKEADSNIDYELISEFSRLGTFIEDLSNPNRADLTNLPPRSARRPALADKELARSFYRPVHGKNDFGHYLIRRLYQDWKTVHIDETFAEKNTKSVSENKILRFADEIYVNDTWSPSDYHRSDKGFIKNRRRMMQLENEGFVRAIKVELNEFKKNEMVVHQESVRFTHFFL